MNRLLLLLLLVLWLPGASADISVHVPGGYVSTAPVVLDDVVLVRSSGTFDGNNPPAVFAYGQEGLEVWRVVGPSTVQPDMAELVVAPAGEADCGSWPRTLVVAWSSGRLDGLNPADGSVFWSIQTEVEGWGLTATPVLTPSSLVQVTRDGIEQRCLADGALLARADLGPGWRNPATVVNGTAYVGDEASNVWAWSIGNANATSVPAAGRIRHAPLPLAGGLLVHAQQDAGSVVEWYPLASNGTLTTPSAVHRLPRGNAPGMPVALGTHGAVIADSSGLLHLAWTPEGWDTTPLDTRSVNGPLRVEAGLLLGSENHAEGGFLVLEVASWNARSIHGPLGFGTAPPVHCGDALLLVKDEGTMVVLGEHVSGCPLSPVTVEVDRTPAVWSLSILAAYLVGAAAWKRKGVVHGAKWASPFLLLALVLVLPQLGAWWSHLGPSTAPDDVWNPAWPSSWEGGQVVVFELPSGRVAIGGLPEATTVLEATMAAAVELNLTLTVEQHSLGPWVTAVDGVEGRGWVVDVDGRLLTIGAAQGALSTEAVVVWRPA